MYFLFISLYLKNYMCGLVLVCLWNYNLVIFLYEYWLVKKIWFGFFKKYFKIYCINL